MKGEIQITLKVSEDALFTSVKGELVEILEMLNCHGTASVTFNTITLDSSDIAKELDLL